MDNLTILIDIETAPKKAYVWGMWKQFVSHDQLIDRGYIMSCTIKVLGEPEVLYKESRTEDDYGITQWILMWLDKADFVVAHNGKGFDIPFIQARAVVNSLPPPSPFKVIDTLLIARKEFMFTRNTLQNLAEELGCEHGKLVHKQFPGFKLWDECMKGNEEAWVEMKEYNKQDVIVLEEVYLKLRPWDTKHPNVNVGDEDETIRCPKCGSKHVYKRGTYTTNAGKYQRYQCESCKGWSRSRYTENTLGKRKSLLTSR